MLDLAKTVESQHRIASEESGVSDQRARNMRYYTLQPLGNEIDGRSKYISPDVFDVVETKKSFFQSVFLSGRRVVYFKPVSGKDKLESDLKTAYVFDQFQKNRIANLFRDGWHDAFVSKRMVVHVDWYEDYEVLEQDVDGLTPAQVQSSLDGHVIDIDASGVVTQMTPQGPVLGGSVRVARDTSRVRITLVQPERYYRDPNRAYVLDSAYAGFERDVTRGQLLKEGYDPEQVESLKSEYSFEHGDEESARKAHDQSAFKRPVSTKNSTLDTLKVLVHYAWLDMEDYDVEGFESGLRLYKVEVCSGEVLRRDGEPSISEVPEIPFFEWTEHKISHSPHGMATSDVVAHTQRANSVLKRLVIDNQQMRNMGRTLAEEQSVLNPAELLNGSIGGVVWTKQGRLGAIKPLDVPELSPYTFNAIGMMERDNEKRSGVSEIVKGTNNDVVSHQNAADMIERMTTSASRRIMAACRDFANTFLAPLAQYVCRLGARHDKNYYAFEVSGAWIEARPEMWEDAEFPMEVHPALTPEEGARQAQALLTLHGTLMQSPQAALMYTPQEMHALLDDVADALGIMDTSRYMARPGSPEYQMRAAMQQQQVAQQQMAQQQAMALQNQILQSGDMREWFKARVSGMETTAKVADMASDNTREDEKLAHQKVVDFAELAVERDQKRGVSVG